MSEGGEDLNGGEKGGKKVDFLNQFRRGGKRFHVVLKNKAGGPERRAEDPRSYACSGEQEWFA